MKVEQIISSNSDTMKQENSITYMFYKLLLADTMLICDLEDCIKKANESYRSGNPIMSDQKYDDMLDEYKKYAGEEMYNELMETLTEKSGSNKFKYKVGSLKKFKCEEPENFTKWIKKYNFKELFCSEKINGVSCVLEYRNYKLVKASSKGDGASGTDWTDKAMRIPSVPKEINFQDVDIRGEFTLTGDSHIKLNFKTQLNGTIGMMNKDEIHPNIDLIQFYAYEVITGNWNIEEQFDILLDNDFAVPMTMRIRITDIAKANQIVKDFYIRYKQSSPYDIDGMVVSGVDYKPELDKHYPDKKIAWKTNDIGEQTTVIGIEWNISKGRKLKPVVLIEPINIDGATINRVTGFNAKYIKEQQIDCGAVITCNKSGSIIPNITGVIAVAQTIFLPEYCPECSSNVNWNGVELECMNDECGEVKRISYFLKQLDIENVSDKSLVKWNITSFDDLIDWKADSNYKSQVKFQEELNEKMWKASEEKLMRSFSCNGMGTTNFDKLIAAFGSVATVTTIIYQAYNETFNFNENILPIGIGIKTLSNSADEWIVNLDVLNQIISNEKYVKATNSSDNTNDKKQSGYALTGKTFIITGTLSQPRKYWETIIRDNGGTVASGISRTLNYLIVGEDAGSKLSKAQNLGIDILNETQFKGML